MHTLGKLESERVLLLGLGSRARFTPEVLRLAAGRAAKTAQRLKVRALCFSIPAEGEALVAVRAVVEGLELGAYRFERYKSSAREEKNAPKLTTARLLLPAGLEKTAALEQAVALARHVAESTNWARDLINEPPNVVNPERLARPPRRWAARPGLKVAVGGRKEIERQRMGHVPRRGPGQHQRAPAHPRAVHAQERQGRQKLRPVALVGKAITFDSGGLSLKPADAHDRHEDGHGRLGRGARRHARHRRAQAALPRARLHRRVREHALGHRLPAR